jgi:putative nucleotidyltransferase with HDIG domain
MATGSSTQPHTKTLCPCRAELLAALSHILDYSPSGGVSHHARVTILAAKMASHLRRVDRIDTLYASLIHDIGLAGEPREPDGYWSLEEESNQPMIRSHPLVGAQLAATIPEWLGVAEIVLNHHECFNGHGYPRGKCGDEILPAAQILRFADTCDFALREQTSPELISFLHAVRGRTVGQVHSSVADAGIEVLGEEGFYPQLLTPENVEVLLQGTLQRLAPEDLATTDAEVTAILELFGHVADAYHADRTGHSRRVANLAVLVAMALGLEPEETAKIKRAALVHDIGMVTVPKLLLDKPERLTSEELDDAHRHITATEEFLAPVHGLEEITTIAVAHGEAFDGSGYPRGLSGNEIPLGARILAVCNTFDALTSRRPYREARHASLAIDILIKGSGLLFDPDVVTAAVPAFLISQSAEEKQAVGA